MAHISKLDKWSEEGGELAVTGGFPFQSTPSGKLKIVPNQILFELYFELLDMPTDEFFKKVVFESEKVSILVADPRHTKVNVKADLAVTDGVSQLYSKKQPSPADLFSRLPQKASSRENADGDYPKGPHHLPIHFMQRPVMDESVGRGDIGAKNEHGGDPLKTEVDLASMGFSIKEPIDWLKYNLPNKSNFLELLYSRISQCIFPDTLIVIGEFECSCHMLALQCYAKYFKGMKPDRIELSEKNVRGDIFYEIYLWMIHSDVESYKLIRRDNILEIFGASQFLKIKELEDQCWAIFDNEDIFMEETAFTLYLEARRLHCVAVMELMVPRIQNFFLTLVSSKDFLELSVEDEMEVFMAGVRWLMYDCDNRQQHTVDVMKCIRFGLIAPWQLVDIRRNPESPEFIMVTKQPEVYQLIEDGLAFAIIKYYYGRDSTDYHHWIEVLGLQEPAARNWAKTDKNYLAYRDFLLELEVQRQHAMEEKRERILGGRVDASEPHHYAESMESLMHQTVHARRTLSAKPAVSRQSQDSSSRM